MAARAATPFLSKAFPWKVLLALLVLRKPPLLRTLRLPRPLKLPRLLLPPSIVSNSIPLAIGRG
jgi:hypothetical protein